MFILNNIFLIILLFSIKTKAQSDALSDDQSTVSEDPGERAPNQNVEGMQNPKTNEKKKYPMKCIPDNEKYCKNKFDGFQFRDGCHLCTCKKNGNFFCPKGPCEYYAKSFEEVVDYCKNINKKNELSFEEQKKKKENPKKQVRKNIIKDMKIKKVKASKKKDGFQEIKKDSDRTQIVKSSQAKAESLNNELQNLMKSANNPFDKIAEKNENSKSSLDAGLLGKLPENSDRKLSTSNKGNTEEKTVDQSSEKSRGKPSELEEKEEPKSDSETKVKTDILNSLKSPSNNLTKIFQIPPQEKTVDKNLVKVSLEKMSDRKVIKQMIYQLAKNEIAIERLKHQLIKSHRKKDLISLKNLERYNSQYKMKILSVVKREMVKSKSNPSKTKFYLKDIHFFKNTYKKLVRINKILREMKHESSKKSYRRHRRHYGGTGNVKVSIFITFISVFLVLVVFNY